MALTYYEKQKLDNAISKIENSLKKADSFTIDYIKSQLVKDTTIDFDYNTTSVLASLNRLYSHDFGVAEEKTYNSPTKYRIKAYVNVLAGYGSTFKKDKNLLYFNVLDITKPLIYDFNTKKFNIELSDIKNSAYIKDNLNLFDYEWIFNYTDDLSHIYEILNDYFFDFDRDYFKTMPKDLLKFKEIRHYEDFDRELFRNHYIFMNYGVIGENLFLSANFGIDDLNNVKQVISLSDLMKLYINDVKIGKINFISVKRDTISFVNYINNIKNYNTNFSIDINKGFMENLKMVKDLIDSKRNEILAFNLQKLNFLNNMVISQNYIIVVPQGIEDLQNEGSMQHNCVGHYYNDKIARGEDLIYFLRKVDDKEQSFITCRFNMNSRITAECRYKFNNDIPRRSPDYMAIIEIDKIIRENLKLT